MQHPTTTGRGLFICATGSRSHATSVAAALASMLVNQGHCPGVFQPIETGRAKIASGEDAGHLLQWATHSALDAERICPISLQDAGEPAVAARRENRSIPFNTLLEQANRTLNDHTFSLIIGNGGLMVPWAGGLTTADFAAMLQLPLLLVCRAGKDVLNNLLLTLLAARHLQLEVAGYLLTDYMAVANPTLPHDLAVITAEELVALLEPVSGTVFEQATLLSNQLSEQPTLSLLGHYLPVR